MLFRSRFAETFGYFNTFGGNPVCSAAALAVIETIEEEGLVAHAGRIGGHLAAELRALSRDRPSIGEVRGAGLYLGVDIVDPATGAPDPARAGRLINDLRARRVLIGAAGPFGHVLKIRPPLCLSQADADLFLKALADCPV